MSNLFKNAQDTPDITPKYNCLECGACCFYICRAPNVKPLDEVHEVMRSAGSNCVMQMCPYLEGTPMQNVKCVVYENRPLFCRKFAVGSQECEKMRDFYKVMHERGIV